MYATANEYLRLYKLPNQSLLSDQDVYLNGNSGIPENKDRLPIIPDLNKPQNQPEYKENKPEPVLNMNWTTENKSTSDPSVWGPAFWLSLHISAVHYPDNPSQIVKDRMKGRILAIPYEISCNTCRPHAIAFIETNRDNLDKIVSNKHNLGRFYVDFHNKVNERYGKKLWTYEDAYKVYSGKAKITFLN